MAKKKGKTRSSGPTVKELRKELAKRKIPGRSKLKTKAQMMAALGMGGGKSKKPASSKGKKPAVGVKSTRPLAEKLGVPENKLMNAVRREVRMAKKANPNISRDELRKVGVKVLAKEAKKVRSEKPVQKKA